MYFGTGVWKESNYISNQQPPICLIAKFWGKTKIPKVGTKNHLFGYFEQKTGIFINVRATVLKTLIVRFEISTLEFV